VSDELPLSGCRVLDLSRVLAGPLATQILGDLGADVIKIERPGEGDDTRHWGPPFVGHDAAYYLSLNRNKRSAAVDLKSPEGADAIRDLAEAHHIGILLTDHQFRETLEVTDRCYLIREGRVFAWGNREQILNNPDVRRYYIGERFDVGHLLDKQPHRQSLGQEGPGSSDVVIDHVDDEPGPTR